MSRILAAAALLALWLAVRHRHPGLRFRLQAFSLAMEDADFLSGPVLGSPSIAIELPAPTH